VSHLVPKPRDKRHSDDKIDVRDLDEILEIDPVAMTCTAGAPLRAHRPRAPRDLRGLRLDEGLLSQHGGAARGLPLRTPHYYFRYDNGVTNVHPRTALGRLLFGRFLHSAQILRLADTFHRVLPVERPDVTVDVFLPFSRCGEFMAWYEREIGFFPLWCVPYRRVRDYDWIAPDFFTDPGNRFRDLYAKTCRAARGLEDLASGAAR
jgi:hypothetical protein